MVLSMLQRFLHILQMRI
ncbi:hypothetical protein MTR67_012982 [Solanum verrucosum]|uniref:Uncharacterized protein n=1 Tax=Solanum verrucosum TaxID=315347 RepID=A0AAF0TGG0_SOLVR|nr:hypothetical protein MTR67_012982 [Solanum verrucosum]